MKPTAGRSQTGMFTASEVEAQTGVPATTLRQWERRYGFPHPARNASGYRLYSPGDVAAIQYMQSQLQSGVPASRAAELISHWRLKISWVSSVGASSPNSVSRRSVLPRSSSMSC